MKTTKYLKNKLEIESLDSISIYYKGRNISKMAKIKYHAFLNNNFIFKIKDVTTKYVISEKEIEDIILVPFDNSVIILVLNNDINIEIKFKKIGGKNDTKIKRSA